MADATYVAISLVIAKSQNLLFQQKILSPDLQRRIKSAVEALHKLLLLSAPASPKYGDKAARLLASARDAEDIADGFALKSSRHRRLLTCTAVMRTALVLHLLSLHKMAVDYVARVEDLSRILTEIRGDLAGQVPSHVVTEHRSIQKNAELGKVESEIVGCRDCVNELVLELIPREEVADVDDVDDNLRVISVVGSEVTGKTALVRSVYSRPDVKRRFGCVVWVNVQEDFAVGDVLVDILKQISTHELKDIDRAEEEELSRLLHGDLMKQRYLVVLDNLHSTDLMEKLLMSLADSRNGSRVIITTRNGKLPRFIDPWIDPITLRPLTEEESKQLLLLCSHEIEFDKKQRILSSCIGSPAGILLLGGLKSNTRDSGQFAAMIDRLPANPSLVDMVSLCYHELPYWLKPCILYFCLFPREFAISTRRLLRLWLAEGLVQPPPLSHGGIQDAEICFQELVSRNMIHMVSRRKGHGSAKRCRMPGFVYDFLLQIAFDMGFFGIHHDFSSTNKPKEGPKFVAPRIVADKPVKSGLGRSLNKLAQSNGTSYDLKHLRTYISFNTKKIGVQLRELEIFLKPLVNKGERSLLTVVDLEGVYKPVLPKELGYLLLNLKYLGLRWTVLDELPESVGNLPRLETLDLKHTNITKVPSSIWKKKSLQHLYLNEVCFDKSINSRRMLSSKPSNSLQTLCGLHIEGNSPMLDVLSNLTGITKLSLTCHSTVVKEAAECVSRLTTLQSLGLKSRDLLGQPSKLSLSDMRGLHSLSNLYLFGGLRIESLSLLPENLRSLTLSMSVLAADPMDVLGRLKCLTDLRLYAISYNGPTLTCDKDTFPQLRILKLWKLDRLKSWNVNEQAMPCLEELDIRECKELEKIDGLEHISALREVSLAKVKEELAKSLEVTRGRAIIITKELIVSPTAAEVVEA